MRQTALRLSASIFIMVLLGLGFVTPVAAAEIRVAVATNFAATIREMVRRFEERSAHQVRLAFGSTGKHYAQIKHGAPFDIFFAADMERPRRLEREGLGIAGSRFTYAVGKLVLWSARADYVDSAGDILGREDFRYLAMANPTHAPYGKAAREVLQGRGLWQALQPKLVRGENIGQTFQFVKTGNAELGFVAWSQVQQPGRPKLGSWWEIPQHLYTPIEQQAILLQRNVAAESFLAYVRSSEAQALIRAHGYGTM